MTSSLRPLGTTSVSRSVENPYWYSWPTSSRTSSDTPVMALPSNRGTPQCRGMADASVTTPSAVRQHLAALKSGGFVASRQERGRSGRPVDLYHGTELGESLFAGRSAVGLSVELLGHLQAEDPELVSRVFERRRQRRVEQCQDQLTDKTLAEKVASLDEILGSEG